MKKILLVILLIFALAAVFVACDPIEPQTGHQHSFESKWTYDADSHWHKATCEHTDETLGKTSHNMIAVPGDTRLECNICGYSKQGTNITPDPKPHEHNFATELSADENGHWYAATCEHTTEIKDYAPHSYVDGVCTVCGWWSSATEVLFSNLSKSDIWNYTVFFDDINIGSVNLLSEGLEHPDFVVSGELSLNMDSDGQIEGCGCFQTEGLSLKAVVKAGVVYACGDGTFVRCELDELLKQNDIDLQDYIDKLNTNTQTIREYVEKVQNYVNALPLDAVIGDEMLSSLVKLDETKTTDELSVYYVDTEVLRSINQTLATTKVDAYVNSMLSKLSDTPLGSLLGNDVYALPNKVRSLLSKSIGQTMLDLRLNNYSLDELLDQINQLIATYYPDDKINTIDELLASKDVDLKGMTVKEALIAASMFSPEYLWNKYQEDEDKKISAIEISEKLTEMVDAYADKTIYQILALDDAGITADYIKTLVDGSADLLDDCVTLELYVDADGVLRQISLSVSASDVTYEQAEIEQIRQLLSSVHGSVTLKLDCELEQDYSQVIEQVDEYYTSQDNNA